MADIYLDNIVALDDLYGGSRRLFEQVRRRSAGLSFSYSDLRDRAALDAFSVESQRRADHAIRIQSMAGLELPGVAALTDA